MTSRARRSVLFVGVVVAVGLVLAALAWLLFQPAADSTLLLAAATAGGVGGAVVMGAITGRRMAHLRGEMLAQRTAAEERAADAVQKTALLETILEQLPVGVLVVRADGSVRHRNSRYRRMQQQDTGAVLSDDSNTRVSNTTTYRVPFDRWPIVRALRDGEAVEGWSGRVHDATGRSTDVMVSSAPLRGPAGEPAGAVSVLTDVSEQKEVARRLRRSDERLRMTLQAARMIVAEWQQAAGTFRDPAGLARWLELPSDATLANTADLLAFVHPDDADRLAEKLVALARGGARCETVFRVNRPDAGTAWVLCRSAVDEDESGPTGTVTSVLVDVTERYRHLDRLRLLESAVVHARDAVIILEDAPAAGGGRNVIYANNAFHAMTGYTPDEVAGRSLHFLRGPDSDEATLRQLRQAMDERRVFQCELLNYRKDGSAYWVELSLVPVPDPAGRYSHWVMIQRDASDRKEAEAQLRSNRERLAEAQRIAHIGSWEYNPTTGQNSWSDEEYLIFGRDPATGSPTQEWVMERIHPDDRPRLTALHAHPTEPQPWLPSTCEFRIVRAGGEVRHLYAAWAIERAPDGQLLRVNGVTHDITERKRTQEQLFQAQKMELIGQMAGGIAHDFNNMLTGLLGHLELIRMPAEDPNRRILDTVLTAAHRATKMSKNLLSLARKSNLRRVAASLGPVVAEVAELVGRTCDPRIELTIDVGTDAAVEADPTFLHQVLLNLCLNARDAMPHGGRLLLGVDEVELAADHPTGRSGLFVRVRVEDTGLGMTPEVKARVFEPFFTTKPIDKGTGLGLAMVQSIIEQHKGWVECESEVGRGTRFDVYLPWCETPVETPSELRLSTPADTPPPPPDRVRTVLVVDDEPMIRDLARAVLEGGGYRVIEAHDGEHAVQVFREHQTDIDLVVLDLTMPKLSGRDTFRALVDIEPAARVMFSSGYTADDMSDTTGVVGLLPKPYRPTELLSAVGKALA